MNRGPLPGFFFGPGRTVKLSVEFLLLFFLVPGRTAVRLRRVISLRSFGTHRGEQAGVLRYVLGGKLLL